MKKMNNYFNEKFSQLLLSHKDEFTFLEERIEQEPNNIIYRRLMIRSIFSSLEIISSALIEYAKPIVIPKLLQKVQSHQDVSEIHQHFHESDYKVIFTFCAAEDKSYKIDTNGDVVIEKLRISFKDRLLFSVKLFFEATDKTVNPKTIPGWEALQQAIKIRDRLTHPKTLEDLKVSEDDYSKVKETNGWVLGCIYYGQ